MTSKSETTGPFAARKSLHRGHVSVAYKLTTRGWHGPSRAVSGPADLTPAAARALAAALITSADTVDAAAAAEAAKKERRQRGASARLPPAASW